MKKALTALAVAAALLLSGCAGCTQEDSLWRFCDRYGIPLSEANSYASSDSHGGFHGDGTRLAALGFSSHPLDRLLAGSADWAPLPLPEDVETIIYGRTVEERGNGAVHLLSVGPFIPYDGAQPIPHAAHGYFYFLDRFPAHTPHSDEDLLHRGAFNFTFALYDSDTCVLYYCEVNT